VRAEACSGAVCEFRRLPLINYLSDAKRVCFAFQTPTWLQLLVGEKFIIFSDFQQLPVKKFSEILQWAIFFQLNNNVQKTDLKNAFVPSAYC
jgi:hypothetical protein